MLGNAPVSNIVRQENTHGRPVRQQGLQIFFCEICEGPVAERKNRQRAFIPQDLCETARMYGRQEHGKRAIRLDYGEKVS